MAESVAAAEPVTLSAPVVPPPFFLDDLASRAMRVAWIWPALLTFLAGCFQLTRPELWRDELSSWSFASRPVPELVTIVHHSDATQLGYYLLLHYWMAAFGDSVIAMRMLSVLAMAGAAACLTLAGRRIAGERAGLLAGLIFALVPSVSRFAQETRFYALEVLVAMLATLLLLRALERPGAGRWLAYAASVAILGYVDLVALCVLAGHAAGVALYWWRDRDPRVFWFGAAAAAALAACLPIALVGLGQAGQQLVWLPRPGLSLPVFSLFGRNLFYSTAAAAALIIVGVFAWAVAWRAAAFATAIALLPVAVVWLVSQGPYSYFFPRYLLLTVGAWSLLAGIALSRLDLRAAAAGVLVFAILGAGDQLVIRERGAHNWPVYPLNSSTSYWDYAGAARVIAGYASPGDGIAYPGEPIRWEMIDDGVQYYLNRTLPAGRVPREVFVARTAADAGTLYAVLCSDAAACLRTTPRMWIVDSEYPKNPYARIPADEAAAMRAHYRVTMIKHVPSLTIFLLVRT